MELIKLLLVFAVMVVVLRLKQPLYLSMLAATIATWLIFRIPFLEFLGTMGRSAISRQTLTVMLLFYSVLYLQRMLEARGSLLLAQQALDSLFGSRRVTAMLGPVFLGLLPSAGVMPVCGQIVEQSVGNALGKEEKAFITTFFRHIPESILPTFASVYIPLSLAADRVDVGSFVLAMAPMVVVLALLGYGFFLRRVPKETGLPKSENKWKDVQNLGKGVWPFALIVFLILALKVEVYLALLATIVLFVLVGRFSLRGELLGFFRTAFDRRMLLSSFCIMIFKDVLSSTGILQELPSIFSGLPIPDIFIFALIFFVGTIISGSQAINVLGIPLVFSAIPGAGLPHFVLLMGISYAANQITPTHVCVAMAAEDFRVGFGSMVRKGIPVIAVFCALMIGYYYVLLAVI